MSGLFIVMAAFMYSSPDRFFDCPTIRACLPNYAR
jgi:hypothetical protein